MEEKIGIRLYLISFCLTSFVLTVVGLTTGSIEAFVVFCSMFAYSYVMLFWNEARK